MIWLGVLIAALVTVPVSVNVHEQNIALAQAQTEAKERAEIAALVEFENDVYFYDQEDAMAKFENEVHFYDQEAK